MDKQSAAYNSESPTGAQGEVESGNVHASASETLSEAIPPDYTEWIGSHLLDALKWGDEVDSDVELIA